MVTMPSPIAAEILSEAAFDWLLIDGEHGALQLTEVLAILQSVGHRIPCLVRVPSSEEVAIKKVLDFGACGIVVPQVNTQQQARDVVRFARYAPDGERGIGLARAQGYGARFHEYLATANDEIAVVVQAEHAVAVQNIQQIAKVAGIDGVFVGPYDLSASLGKTGKLDDPEVSAAIDRVTQVCQAERVALGIFGISADAVAPAIAKGYSLIAVGTDCLFLVEQANKVISDLRRFSER
jgi:2-dehydro-3-deoxyglucarate aldolase/4-hydroxy-2-oxoheptanedioate aldolase